MASGNIVLINNEELKIGDEHVFRKTSANKPSTFITRVTKRDVTSEVQDYMLRILEEDSASPLYPYVPRNQEGAPAKPFSYAENQNSGICAIYTPSYMVAKTILDDSRPAITLTNWETGNRDNLTTRWNREFKLPFIASEMVKYSKLSWLLVQIHNKVLKYSTVNRALKLKHEGQTVFQLIGVTNMVGIVNPFLWIPHIKTSKLFAPIYQEKVVFTSIDEPITFKAELKHSVVLLATLYDTLRLIGIDDYTPMNNEILLNLIAGIALTEMGAEYENYELPLPGQVYIHYSINLDGSTKMEGIYRDRSEFTLENDDSFMISSLARLYLNSRFPEAIAQRLLPKLEGGSIIQC